MGKREQGDRWGWGEGGRETGRGHWVGMSITVTVIDTDNCQGVEKEMNLNALY